MLANITLNFDQAPGTPLHRMQTPNVNQENLQLPKTNAARPRVSSPEVIIRPGVSAALLAPVTERGLGSDSMFIS